MSVDMERVTENTPVLNAALRALSRDIILRGVLEALVGVLLLLKPLQTAAAVTVMIGIFLLVDGATLLLFGIRSAASPGKKWMIVNAIALLLLGAITVWRPIMVDSLWVVMLGVWQILGGVECLAGGGKRLWSVLSGVLSLIVGAIFIVSPFAGLFSLIWLIGVLLLVSGVVTIIAGVKFRV